MSFHVHISDPDQAYLDGLPLSPEAKARINRFVKDFIANVSDEFRDESRLKPDSPYFRVQHLILDRWGDGRIHAIDFYIQDDNAKFGVLLIVFIDHH